MSMNFLNGMQIRQFKKILVKGFRFSQRLFRENRFPVNIIPVKIDFPCFFSHENLLKTSRSILNVRKIG